MGSHLTGVHKHKGCKLSDGNGKRKGGRHFHDNQIHWDTSTRYYGTLHVTWTHGKERLRGLVLYRTLY
jgi:hypothetical protein